MPEPPLSPRPGQLPDGPAPIFYDNRAAVVAVTLFGVLVIVVPLGLVYRSIHASLAGEPTQIIGMEGLFAFAYVVLGVGIILRREKARFVLVCLLSFGLLVMLVELVGSAGEGEYASSFVARAAVQLLPIVFLAHPAIRRVFR